MQPALASLLIFVIACQLSTGKIVRANNDDLKENFLKINKYLTETIESADIELNMNQAATWLAKQTKTSCTSLFKKRDKFLVEALKQFLALRTLADGDKCNQEGYEIVYANRLASATTPPTYWSLSPKNGRVEVIVRHYATKHAEICAELYPTLISSAFAKIPESHQNYINTSVEKRVLLWDESGHKIYETITELSGVERAALKGNKAKVEELFNEYLTKPCMELNEKVGSKYLKMFRFDTFIVNADDIYNKADLINVDLWKIIQGLNMCDVFEDYKDTALDRVIEFVEN